MKYKVLMLLSIILSKAVQGQTISDDVKDLFGDLNLGFSTELFFGATASFSRGAYMDYQKSYSNVTYPETEIKSNIRPLYFGTFGVDFGFKSKDTSEFYSRFKLLTGMSYFQRGFSHRYSSVYSPEGLSMEDKLIFTETYRASYLSVPLTIRYEGDWFAEVGLTYDMFLFASRKHKLERSVSGGGAYKGGFSASDRTKYAFNENLFSSSVYGINLAGGKWISEKVGFRALVHFTPNAFANGSELRNQTIQAQLLIKM